MRNAVLLITGAAIGYALQSIFGLYGLGLIVLMLFAVMVYDSVEK